MGRGIWDLVTPGFSYRLREAVRVAGRLNWGWGGTFLNGSCSLAVNRLGFMGFTYSYGLCGVFMNLFHLV